MRLKKLKDKHYRAMTLLLAGRPRHEVAELMDVDPVSITNWTNDPLFQEALESFRDDLYGRVVDHQAEALSILAGASPEAAQLCVNIMSGNVDGIEIPTKLRLQSAWDILDRSGVKPVQKTITGHINLSDLVKDAYLAKRNNGQSND